MLCILVTRWIVNLLFIHSIILCKRNTEGTTRRKIGSLPFQIARCYNICRAALCNFAKRWTAYRRKNPWGHRCSRTCRRSILWPSRLWGDHSLRWHSRGECYSCLSGNIHSTRFRKCSERSRHACFQSLKKQLRERWCYLANGFRSMYRTLWRTLATPRSILSFQG